VRLFVLLLEGEDCEASTEAVTAEYTNNYLVTPRWWWVLLSTNLLSTHAQRRCFVIHMYTYTHIVLMVLFLPPPLKKKILHRQLGPLQGSSSLFIPLWLTARVKPN